MKIVGLTGGIATGKSTVSRELIKLGVPLIDCDQIAKDVVKQVSSWECFKDLHLLPTLGEEAETGAIADHYHDHVYDILTFLMYVPHKEHWCLHEAVLKITSEKREDRFQIFRRKTSVNESSEPDMPVLLNTYFLIIEEYEETNDKGEGIKSIRQ